METPKKTLYYAEDVLPEEQRARLSEFYEFYSSKMRKFVLVKIEEGEPILKRHSLSFPDLIRDMSLMNPTEEQWAAAMEFLGPPPQLKEQMEKTHPKPNEKSKRFGLAAAFPIDILKEDLADCLRAQRNHEPDRPLRDNAKQQIMAIAKSFILTLQTESPDAPCHASIKCGLPYYNAETSELVVSVECILTLLE